MPKKRGQSRAKARPPNDGRVYTWSELNEKQRPAEKHLMGSHCAMHRFLVPAGSNPETAPREKLSSVLVNGGTSPTLAVREALEWMVENPDRGPFDVTWYTTSSLVPAALREYRDKYPRMASATNLFLFPGRVDQQMEAVLGPDAEAFAKTMDRRFRFAFLGAHAFDMRTGKACFHLPEEVGLQSALATRYAVDKFLFLDSSKFTSAGAPGYSIGEALATAETFTIYTVASTPEHSAALTAQFQYLCKHVLVSESEAVKPATTEAAGDKSFSDVRTLQLVIVGRERMATECRTVKMRFNWVSSSLERLE